MELKLEKCNQMKIDSSIISILKVFQEHVVTKYGKLVFIKSTIEQKRYCHVSS